MRVREFCLRQALRLAARYPAPARPQPWLGRSRARIVAVSFAGIEAGGDVHADGLRADRVVGRGWDDERKAYVRPVEVSLVRACQALTELRFELRDYIFRSDDPVRFMLSIWSGWFRLRAWRGDRSLSAFERRHRERRRRMTVLRRLIEVSVRAGHNTGVRPAELDLLDRGPDGNQFFHPGHVEQVHHILFLLDSLAAEGLAKRAEHGYVIEPAAFAALDAFDTEERRHADNRRIQRLLAFIGLLALIGSLAQAAAAIKQTWYPDRQQVENAHGIPVALPSICARLSTYGERAF